MDFVTALKTDLDTWTIEKICDSLVSAKKIEDLIKYLKELARSRIEQGEKITTTSGSVYIGTPSVTLTHDEQNVSEIYLLPAIRPLNRSKVRAHLKDTGRLPQGVRASYRKAPVFIKPNW